MLLYSRVLAQGENFNIKVDELRGAEIFLIDNVARYFFQVDERDDWSLKDQDFPNIAPPFPLMWFEFPAPTTLRTPGKVTSVVFPWTKIGIAIRSFEAPDNKAGIKWVLNISYMMGGTGQFFAPAGHYAIFVSENGQYLDLDGHGFLIAEYEKGAGKTLSDAFVGLCGPAMLALSFLHCRNVKMVQRGGRAPGEPRQRKATIRHHVLEIEPMKRVLETEGRASATGIHQALHICRGHFKDFTRGKGLFGKYQGVYWWDQTVKGNAAHGVVTKDYSLPEITTPPGERQDDP